MCQTDDFFLFNNKFYCMSLIVIIYFVYLFISLYFTGASMFTISMYLWQIDLIFSHFDMCIPDVLSIKILDDLFLREFLLFLLLCHIL